MHVAGKISLPSAVLQFWDLGGQRGIRSIWPKYYDDCHAVVYVVDAVDHERLSEGWEVFGMRSLPPFPLPLPPSCFLCTIPWGGGGGLKLKLTCGPLQIPSYRPRRSSASRFSYWRTSRTTPTRSPLRRFGTSMRCGTNIRSRARGGGRAARWTTSRGGSASPVWTSWACPRWKGERPPSYYELPLCQVG